MDGLLSLRLSIEGRANCRLRVDKAILRRALVGHERPLGRTFKDAFERRLCHEEPTLATRVGDR